MDDYDGERGREVMIGIHPELQRVKQKRETGKEVQRSYRKREKKKEKDEKRAEQVVRGGVQRWMRSGFDPVVSRGN